MTNIPCVILCGGKSSRMGEDKSLLPFSSSNTLAEFQYNRLKTFFKNVYISSKTNKFDFLEEDNLILDKNKEIYSPILALESIFEKFIDGKIFIITVDTPFVLIESIEKIIKESSDVDICIAQTEKIHNLCGVFSSTTSSTIKTMINQDIHKIFYLIRNSKHKIIEFLNDDEFMNINNKNEYYKSISFINNSYDSDKLK